MPKKKEVVKMTKVKNDTLPPSLRLDLNGKALLMLDTDEWGPIELRIDDKETAVELLRVIVDNMGNIYCRFLYESRRKET